MSRDGTALIPFGDRAYHNFAHCRRRPAQGRDTSYCSDVQGRGALRRNPLKKNAESATVAVSATRSSPQRRTVGGTARRYCRVMMRAVLRLAVLWPVAAAFGLLLAHGLRGEYILIELATAGTWALVLAPIALAAVGLLRAGRRWTAAVALLLGALVAVDVAVVVDSWLIYDVAGYWMLNDGVPLPYGYAPLWYPASLIPGDIFGVTQQQITAGDFEWQAEHITPVALTLTAVSVVFLIRTLSPSFGRTLSPRAASSP
jgi:hypothetical protein